MEKVSIVGVDISKRSFSIATAIDGFRPARFTVKKLSRSGFLPFLKDLPPCLVVMEACGGAHHWGRQISARHRDMKCRLIPPVYVKPFVKRHRRADRATTRRRSCEAGAAVSTHASARRQGEAGSGPGRRRCCSGPALFSCGSALQTRPNSAAQRHLAEFGLEVGPAAVANVEALRCRAGEGRRRGSGCWFSSPRRCPVMANRVDAYESWARRSRCR